MKHGSLFSGVGGFDLAAQWMGWENEFHCEWNEFGRKVLKYYWPKAKSYDDITKTDFTIHRGTIDIITGGFPCQPYSQAGKRLGTADDRHLWPHMLRTIQEVRPRWVVGENVRGLVNWNGGMVFDEVQADLEAEGYEVQPFLIPACAVNAPHRRDRIWIVAYADQSTSGFEQHPGTDRGKRVFQDGESKRAQIHGVVGNDSEFRDAPDTESGGSGRLRFKSEKEGSHGGNELFGEQHRLSRKDRDAPDTGGQRCKQSKIVASTRKEKQPTDDFSGSGNAADTHGERPSGKEHRKKGSGLYAETNPGRWWKGFPIESPVCYGDDGIPPGLDGITFPKWRNETIKAAGKRHSPTGSLSNFQSNTRI